VLGLQAGQIAGPVRTVDGWEVVKILDVREVPFEAVQGRLARALANKKRREVRAEVIAELERKHGVVYLSEGIRALLRPEQRAGAADVPLVRHAGGVIAVGAPGVAAALVGVPREFVADSTTLVAVLRDRLMGDSLLVFEARSRGLDQSPEIVALRQEVLKRTMLSELRRREVLEDVAVTPEEIRAAYEANRESYRLGAAVVIREILVHDQATANDLRARILAGENMADLAWAHSERPGAQASQGRFTVYPDAEGDWGGLREHLRQAPVGELVGPVPADGGYSLFRVEERQAERVRSLEEVEHAVRHRLQGEKADKAFAAYTRDLMQKYAAQITWNDENIRRVAATF